MNASREGCLRKGERVEGCQRSHPHISYFATELSFALSPGEADGLMQLTALRLANPSPFIMLAEDPLECLCL